MGTPQPEGRSSVPVVDSGEKSVVIHSTFGSSNVTGWRLVDDYTMIIDTTSHGELVATFMAPCRGLRFTDVVGFNTMGPFDLDRTTRVILPDGTTCHFKELKPYIKLEEPGSEPESEPDADS